jgi:cob(I)alamin adenosyltransferase
MSIATKTGDDGTTALMFGRRVSKTDPRIAANGACDELNAALGLVRASCADSRIANSILSIQRELVNLMGEIAVDAQDRGRYRDQGYPMVSADMVANLTAQIDDLEQKQNISYRGWATPGATPASAALDMARTICRRAERAVCECREKGFSVADDIVRYLNRLSDLCWLWARWIETMTLGTERDTTQV